MASIGLAASCGVGTSRLQRPSIRVGANTRHPMLSASLTSAGKPVGGDPISPTASSQARKCTGSPPPAPGLRCAHALADGVCLFARCTLGSLARVQKPPQGHQPLARYRHHPHTPQPLPTATKTVLAPATQSTLRLIAPPTPRQLCGHPAHVSVASLGHPLVPDTGAAVIRRRC